MNSCTISIAIIVQLITSISLNVLASSPNPPASPLYPNGRDRPHNYQIQSDKIVYSGWRRVIRRTVSSLRHPHHYDEYNAKKHLIDFDIIDQNHGTSGAVIIFAWNSTSKTATIVREYMPGCHRVLGGLAAGLVENEKHSAGADGEQCDSGTSDLGITEDRNLIAARCELEEEW